MRRRRVKRLPLSVSLFPFLAVLICTLGVLIVLLVLAVKSAEVQADADQESQQQRVDQQIAVLKALQGELDQTEVKIELIGLSRPDRLTQLTASREYRGHLESEIRQLKLRARELDNALAEADHPQPVNANPEESERRLEELNQQILLAQSELKKKRDQVLANSQMTYSIVPHAGSGGTFRRPIFVECRRDKITIQPLGVTFDKNDFVPPLGPGNPLDAAILAIREYWQKHDLKGAEGNPYPLIVIRPDGAEGYAMSRRAMSSWEDEFGYELVEADKELDFGPVDSQLKASVEAAVAEAKLRQQSMLAARPPQQSQLAQQASFRPSRGSGGGRAADQRPGLIVSGGNGGFIVNSAWEELEQQGGSHFGSFAERMADESESGRGGRTGGQTGNHFDNSEHFSGTGNSLTQSNNHRLTQNLGASSIAQPPGAGNQHGSMAGSSADGEFQQGQNMNGTSSGGGDSATPAAGQSSSQHQAAAAHSSADSANRAGSSGSPADCESCNDPMMYQHLNLAQSKGKNWAVPNQTPGATAYIRPIRIVCTDSELEFRSPLGVEKRIPFGENIADAVDPLVNEIWRQIESWGIPGERSYWKPELRISVTAGGELNFEKLQGMLFESGIPVKEASR